MASKEEVRIRPAGLMDIPAMARVAADAYQDADLDEYLFPHRARYPADHVRMYLRRRMMCYLTPGNLSFVACRGPVVLGYVQFERLGDDEGVVRQRASRHRLLLWLLSWVSTAWFWLEDHAWPNKAVDWDHGRKFDEWAEVDERIHWSGEEVKNRWHMQSLVVARNAQGLGIGKRLMSEAIGRAQADGLILGLEASSAGEGMYQKLGFELLGRFTGDIALGKATGDAAGGRVPEAKGGVMVLRPRQL